MLLFAVSYFKNIDEIFISYFVPYHGQNEGDSAHSVISNAIKRAGPLYIPSQLNPTIKLARRKHPYSISELNYNDFLNFKEMAHSMRVLSVRKDNLSETVNWKQIREIKVIKSELNKIFFKNSHFLSSDYRYITLKTRSNVPIKFPKMLNYAPLKINMD